MLVVPIEAVPAQTVSVLLGNQSCRIDIVQKYCGLFLDLYIDSALIVGGVICENANRIVRNSYLGFIGDLAFFDTTGDSDPVSTGLGARYILIYLDDDDLADFGVTE